MQAEAFAETFAEAQDCNCDVAVSAQASVWADIWVEAIANAYAETCVGAHSHPPHPFAIACMLLTAQHSTAQHSIATGSDKRQRIHVAACACTLTHGSARKRR